VPKRKYSLQTVVEVTPFTVTNPENRFAARANISIALHKSETLILKNGDRW
jgi:hypothetical protein